MDVVCHVKHDSSGRSIEGIITGQGDGLRLWCNPCNFECNNLKIFVKHKSECKGNHDQQANNQSADTSPQRNEQEEQANNRSADTSPQRNEQEQQAKTQSAEPSIFDHDQTKQVPINGRHCQICDIVFARAGTYQSHLNSNKHMKKAGGLSNPTENIPKKVSGRRRTAKRDIFGKENLKPLTIKKERRI